jgi:hypothetical protein
MSSMLQSPIWQQMRKMCDNSPACAVAIRAQVDELVHKNAALRRELAALRRSRSDRNSYEAA